MKPYLIIFCIIIFTPVLLAQEFPSDYWHKGFSVTYKKDTLRGRIKYDFLDNSIQMSTKKKLLVLTSKTLLFFQIDDEYYNRKRDFFIIPVKENDYKIPILFEVLFRGPMTLLCREYILNTFVSATPFDPQAPYSPQVEQKQLSHYYYILGIDGDIFEITKKKELITYFKDYEVEMAAYIKKNKIKMDQREKLIELLHYYNSSFYQPNAKNNVD